MQCLTPFWKKKENLKPGEIAGPHPCGKCYPCVMRRISGWHFRLSNELKYCESLMFLTLTYDSDFVPISEYGELSLCKSDLQKFFKRLRRACAKLYGKSKVKYYAVGEYGGSFERPHYHAILYNATPELVFQEWRDVETGCSLGNIWCDEVNDFSIGYVVGYTCKSFYSEWNDERAPPFSCMSKYLGVNYVTPEIYNWHKKDLDNRMLIQLDDRKIAMPRYFKNLIYDEQERKRISFFSAQKAEAYQQEREEFLLRRYGDRASEIDLEQKKLLYRKLQLKKEKRKL